MPTDTPLPEPPSSLTDWRGTPFGKGARVYYPFMSGRSCFMAEGTVESIEFVKQDIDELHRFVKRQGDAIDYHGHYERMLKRLRIKVMVRIKRRNIKWSNSKDVVAITRLDNITVI